MRVAYVAQAAQISGAERSLQAMLLAMPGVGVQPLVLCPPHDPLIAWCQANAVPVEKCALAFRDKWRPLRWWLSVRRLRSVLRSWRIELVHCNQLLSYPAAAVAAGRLGIPRVCHLRNELSPQELRWAYAAGVEGILCISRYIEQQFDAGWPVAYRRPLVHTLLNPVCLPRADLVVNRAERHEAAQRLDVEPRGIVFGFIGQLIPIKGLLELLRALEGVPAALEWTLLVAGKDPRDGSPYESRCRQYVEERGWSNRVRFLGFLHDVTPFYRAIDVAVVPSLEEPLGRVPLEAAAHGRPAIAFASGGLPETIQHGRTGWLVAPGNIQALREALLVCLQSPDPAWGLAARQWVESISEPRRYASKVAGLYRRLLGDADPQPTCVAHSVPSCSNPPRTDVPAVW
jgi:glycosyltransferase involved in cell wall biosynthesis